MKLIVGKDLRIIEPSKELRKYCEDFLSVDNPDYLIADRLGRYVGKMSKKLRLYVDKSNEIILPFGCLKSLWKKGLLNDCQYETQFHDFKGNNLIGSIKLYDYQERALNSLKNGKNGILEAPCGSGKTQIGLSLIKELGGKALWLTHTKKLMLQSLERAKANFEGDFGTITEGKIHIGKDITFATVQTMRNIDTEIYENEFDIVVVDECHHCVGTPTNVMSFYKVITNCNARYKFGLTATLTRADSLLNCVFMIIGDKLHTITKAEVGSKIIKAVHIKVNVPFEYNILDYCESDGTINYVKLINCLSEKEERNDLIVNNAFKFYQLGKKQLILCHRVNQVKELSKKISKFCDVDCVVGKIKKDCKFNGSVIIATYSYAVEGLDIPDLDVVHLATPQKSQKNVIQSVGRVERNIPNKERPLVIDYIDTNIPYCVNCAKLRERFLKKQ